MLFFSILASFFVFGTFLVINEFINPNAAVRALKKNNSDLSKQYAQLLEKYKKLDQRLTLINENSQTLRLANNLEPLDYEEFQYGIGGSAFKPLLSSSPGDLREFVENLEDYVNKVSLKIELETNNYKEIENAIKENEKLYDAIPAIRPSLGRIADDFGLRMHPILKIRRMHNGLDIITDIGTDVFAPGGGVVSFAGRRGGYGITLEIDHGFGYSTIYAHLSKIIVKEGQKIKRGDLIAKTGNSGSLSTGPHLHYEVRHNSIPLNPYNFIYDDIQLFEIVKK